MRQRLTALLLAAALALPGAVQARQDNDVQIAWDLSSAFHRGLENPEPPETDKDIGLCDAAWNGLWRVYNNHKSWSTPADLSFEDIDKQVDLWDDRAEAAGEDGEPAAEAATTALFNPWYDAGDYERIVEFAGACGMTY